MSPSPPISPGDVFIFYGLLKQGGAFAPKHINLKGSGAFLGPCRFRGRMHTLGGYPGVVEGNELCHGLRYRLDDASLIAALDRFEEVTGNPLTSLYVRKRTEICDDQGTATGEMAWLYWYNQSVEGAPLVEDGNWPLSAGAPRDIR